MARRKRGHRSSGLHKYARKAVSLIRIVVGVAGFGGPTIRAVMENVGSPGAIPSAIIYRNTGVDGNGNFDQAQAIQTGTQFAATAIILMVLGWAAKRV